VPDHTYLLNFFVRPEPIKVVIYEYFVQSLDMVLVHRLEVTLVLRRRIVAASELVVGIPPELGYCRPGNV
jgi:hypothetical protein